jgi:hypothetical protein
MSRVSAPRWGIAEACFWRALVEHVKAMLLFCMLDQGVLAGVKEIKINRRFILKGVKK